MNIKKIILISVILFILLGIGFRLISINKDITGEETDFINPAKALHETGKSTYYHSEQQPIQTGLIHPPMYLFILSTVVNEEFFEPSMRIINIIFSLLSALVIYLCCKEFVERKDKKLIGLIASSLFLINYYSLSMALTIDIDSASTFFTLTFVYFVLKYLKYENNLDIVLAGIFLLGSICNRYPIAFVVFITLGIYILRKKEIKKHFENYFIVGILAGAAFFAIWTIYSTIFEPGTFLTFFIHNAKLGSESISGLSVYIGSFALNMSQFIRLFTLPFVILFILSLIYFIKSKEGYLKIIIIYTLSILLLFTIISRPAFGYPRYFMTALPGIYILITVYLYDNLVKYKIKYKHIILFFVTLLMSFAIIFVLHPQGSYYQSNGLIKATNLPDFIFNILVSLPLILALFFKDKKLTALIILCALILVYSLYFDIGYLNHNANTKEAGTYLRDNTNMSDLVICPKAIGFYSERKYYVNDFTKPQMNFSSEFLWTYFKKSVENRQMNDSFFWNDEFYGGINPSYINGTAQTVDLATLQKAKYVVLYHPVENIKPEKIIGEYYIYRIN